MVQKVNSEVEVNKPAYMYYLMSKSGQCSPTSDTLDSGTGSDLETTPTTTRNSYTLPTSLQLTNAVSKSMRKLNELSLDGQRRLKSHSSNDSYNTDSEESESSFSCDSLNSSEIMRMKNTSATTIIRASPFGSSIDECLDPTEGTIITSDENNVTKINFLPRSLLRDIRDHSMTIAKNQSSCVNQFSPHNGDNVDECNDAYRNGNNNNKTIIVKSHLKKECNNTSASYTNEPFNLHHQRDTIMENEHFDRLYATNGKSIDPLRRVMQNGSNVEHRNIYETDKYINFHLNERVEHEPGDRATIDKTKDDDSFAGYRDIRASSNASTIRSSKGTIRGVKNRVRNGIATFLQMQQTNVKVSARSCDGGHRCSPPKECCAQGCCYLYAPPSAPKTQTPNNTSHVLNLFFINHWFFWCTIFAIIIAILCACSLWKKRRQICGWGSPRPHSQSGDSAGSCYAPPQYSRCTSFHHAPPPYTEVTNKPDLYPLVFSCNNSDNGKNGASYLMVQYFRNYIVRPVGSLSATSTVDSLSSSFICNANEANTLIPPPYSRAGSPNLPMNIQDYSTMPRSASQMCSLEHGQNQRSIPVVMTNSNFDGDQITLYRHYHDFTNENVGVGGGGGGADDTSFVQFRRTPNSVSFQELNSNSTNENVPSPQNSSSNNNIRSNPNYNSVTNNDVDTHDDNDSDLSKPCNVIVDPQSLNTPQTFDMNATSVREPNNSSIIAINNHHHKAHSTNAKNQPMQNSLSYSNSSNGFFDSYDSIDDANECGLNMVLASQSMAVSSPTCTTIRDFNDLNGPRKNRLDTFDVINEEKPLNVSSSLPFSEESPVNADMLKKYGMTMRGYTDSMSGSAVSSLANFDSPTSPPQATSPTGEIRELLEQIRQLQQNANSPDGQASSHHEVQSGAATTMSNESSSIGPDAYDGDESSTSTGMINKMIQRPSSFQQNRRSHPRTRFFAMSAAKNLRSPIGSGNILSFSRNRIGWISKSAPTTPGTAMPASYLNDDSPLLNEHDEDAEPNA